MRKGRASRRTIRRPAGEAGVHGHPATVGARLPVFITTEDSKPTFEGWAHIVSACASYPHWYRVRFEHEQVDRIRLVLPPSLHGDPVLGVELLRELLHTRGLCPWSEFFPPD
jgi:hypothetical protein